MKRPVKISNKTVQYFTSRLKHISAVYLVKLSVQIVANLTTLPLRVGGAVFGGHCVALAGLLERRFRAVMWSERQKSPNPMVPGA